MSRCHRLPLDLFKLTLFSPFEGLADCSPSSLFLDPSFLDRYSSTITTLKPRFLDRARLVERARVLLLVRCEDLGPRGIVVDAWKQSGEREGGRVEKI
jgi:hypothetical protein